MKTSIVLDIDALPKHDCPIFFHSNALFRMVIHTPYLSPCLVLLKNERGGIIGRLLSIIEKRWNLFSISLFRCARIYGEGAYDASFFSSDAERSEAFALMFDRTMKYLHEKSCFRIEVSDVSKKIFAYRVFRHYDFVPIPWLKIHNSLHSKPPTERLITKTAHRIEKAYKAGIKTWEASNETEVSQLYELIRSYYRFRKQRHIPHRHLFLEIAKSQCGHVYITSYKGRIIGGTVVVDSEKDALIWFDTSLKRRFLFSYPHYATIWFAIQQAFRCSKEHIRFMNVGLPYGRNQYRNFILGFGGKPVTSYRWFRFSFPLVNRFLYWCFRT
ncbi:MAG: GNAT family N-acetyltransferase [Prevotella sp.]|nr:GNAT family N-acetyltransferase [Prevotella sp.]